jgi:hypothetical protein
MAASPSDSTAKFDKDAKKRLSMRAGGARQICRQRPQEFKHQDHQAHQEECWLVQAPW